MTSNDVMALTLRYFNQFAKSAFQVMTGSSSIKVIDQKSASVTHIAVKLTCVTKFTRFRVAYVKQFTFAISYPDELFAGERSLYAISSPSVCRLKCSCTLLKRLKFSSFLRHLV